MNNSNSNLHTCEYDSSRDSIIALRDLLNKLRNAAFPIISATIITSVTLSIIINYLLFQNKNTNIDNESISITESTIRNTNKNISNLILKSIKFANIDDLIKHEIGKSANDKNKITTEQAKYLIDKTLYRYADMNDCLIFDVSGVSSSNKIIYGAEDISTQITDELNEEPLF